MKFENTSVMNFKNAFRGLRNPLESWNKSDSWGGLVLYADDYELERISEEWVKHENDIRLKNGEEVFEEESNDYMKAWDKYMFWLSSNGALQYQGLECAELFYLGPNDLSLAQRMIKAGASDRKFLRQILVSVDITAPLYWWKEFDTYKVGTTANSTSTMHKLASTPITKECFEMGDFDSDMMMYEKEPYNPDIYMSEFWDMFVNDLEYLRKKYNETKDQKYWKELIRLLPEGWLQTRTVTLNYEIIRNMYDQRKNHRLVEWRDSFCDWVETLPYSKELITFNLDKKENL